MAFLSMISPDLTVTHLQPIAIPDDRMRADATCHVTDVSAERGGRCAEGCIVTHALRGENNVTLF